MDPLAKFLSKTDYHQLLEDAANALFIGVTVITAVAWGVARVRGSERWMKRLRAIFIVSASLAILPVLWRMGWLTRTVTWPVWGLVLYVISVPLILLGIGYLILVVREHRHPAATPVSHFPAHGALWRIEDGMPDPPPICPLCLADMRTWERVRGAIEFWRCPTPDCKHPGVSWPEWDRGPLINEVRALYTGEMRRRTLRKLLSHGKEPPSPPK